ncbi:MAG: Na+/H+ antiporter subunit E [Rhodobacterales bacterium CG18_big_fil_WC_8_21_14_2_50_71_9]|nr:MAG: Na+/H+ antiporter subunit E [Rhodobacterales bacterium CG18_big_fil_WC_8_21_14_2_50_71_9]PIY72841.1 MAG: Na+/H+ antiporter subunit E [Rhodobacterales bacterium CG_4_10_14_0_8_um_filter_70_9]PJA59795.1 MAG: Na+/H+ antiporter subunit E [Rhodobacterales bacterium CG_4_9_14_3_um_filter_71_31]
MLARLVPYPLLSLALAASWVMLGNALSLNAVVMGLIVGLVIPPLTAAFWPHRPEIHNPLKLLIYFLLVVWDIVVANVVVAKIILTVPNAQLASHFITLPLTLRSPEGISLLAGTITMTPGTVSCELSADGRSLLVHALHAPDPDAARDEMLNRYEARLLEIFA